VDACSGYGSSSVSGTLTAGAGTTVPLVPGSKDEIYTDGATNVASLVFPTSTSWTPTLIGGTVAGAQTYVLQLGQYKLFGNLVWVWGYVEISAKDGAASGDVTIGGLPYTVQASRNYAMTLGLFNLITYTGQLSLRATASTTTLKLAQNPSGGSPSFVQMSGIGTTTYIDFNGWYKRS